MTGQTPRHDPPHRDDPGTPPGRTEEHLPAVEVPVTPAAEDMSSAADVSSDHPPPPEADSKKADGERQQAPVPKPPSSSRSIDYWANNPGPEDVEKAIAFNREKTRRLIAGGVLLTFLVFVVTYMVASILAAVNHVQGWEVAAVPLAGVFAAITGIVGTVLGFYFGQSSTQK